MENCIICNTPLDPVWAQVGQTKHSWCIEDGECSHGEIRGSRYCALCRYANPLIEPPVPTWVKKKRRRLTPA